MRKICLLILVGLFLAGCAPKYPTLFEDPVCEPPCWQNITPGVTTKQDALTKLHDIYPADKQVIDHNSSGTGFDDYISFSPYNDFSLLGEIEISNNRVSMIDFAIYTKYTGIRLDHSIELFGIPQNILVMQYGEYDQVTLINAQKGTSFGYKLFGNESVTSAEIGPNTEIREISFFDPSQYQRVMDSEEFNSLQPWNGYGSFKDKYLPTAAP
ncbi:MAG: hypothetical protein WBW94_06770 [Anaerolineales bacterium]